MSGARSQALDVHNAVIHLDGQHVWGKMKDRGVRFYRWEADDALADSFLMQFGDYRSPDEIRTDYRDIVARGTQAIEVGIAPALNLPADAFAYPTIRFVSRFGLESPYDTASGWDAPGFFSGDASNFDDLICYWNLRASNIPLLFVDPRHIGRYGDNLNSWAKDMKATASRRVGTFDSGLAVWARLDPVQNNAEGMTAILKPFEGHASAVYRVSSTSWNGLNIRPSMVQWPTVSTLGVIDTARGLPKVTFALDNKPFCGSWFHYQHLVASLSFVGGLHGDAQHVLVPPFVPELNEFYARTMRFEYNKLRSESESLGSIIDASDESSFIVAVPVAELLQRIFELAGYSSKLSAGGLIARQLITQMGGVDRTRVFKIPGVRRLLKTHGPTASFTRKSALELIGGRDPENPSANFSDHERLFIEPRSRGSKLEPAAVFTHLVDKVCFAWVRT